MSDLQRIADEWHGQFSKAFITQVSESGSYYIKVKFRTMAEMHAAYEAMAKLAELTSPPPNPHSEKVE